MFSAITIRRVSTVVHDYCRIDTQNPTSLSPCPGHPSNRVHDRDPCVVRLDGVISSARRSVPLVNTRRFKNMFGRLTRLSTRYCARSMNAKIIFDGRRRDATRDWIESKQRGTTGPIAGVDMRKFIVAKP